MTTLTRDQLVKAFPDQPILVAQLEALSDLLGNAQETLDALQNAVVDAQAKIDGQIFQPFDAFLSAISNLPSKVGAIEVVGTDEVVIRGIDTTDPASLLSRSAAYSVLIGRAGKGTTAQRPTLAASQMAIYFDTTLAAAGKPIFWTGTAWVDSTGTTV